MKEIVRTNDVALISFVEAILSEARIGYFVADAHTSVVEGSIGALQRRILVDEHGEDDARRLLADAGVSAELRQRK
jgi:hypothetical protein